MIDNEVAPPSALAFWTMARGFWSGYESKGAWILTASALTILLCNLAVNIGLNRWNRWFFDALERKDRPTLFNASMALIPLVVLGAAFAVAMVRAKMTLQVRWRGRVTERLLERWLSDQRYYKLSISDGYATSPESRITDDVRLATEPVVDCAVGLINSMWGAITFVGILFVVGGSLEIWGVVVPGYIAIAALLYSSVVSAPTFLIGKPLSAAVDRKSESEAQFRFGLTRIR
jgi:vitamin B12/bleomycin/antimicrobial peptide transport system ATP-binding/permease protein